MRDSGQMIPRGFFYMEKKIKFNYNSFLYKYIYNDESISNEVMDFLNWLIFPIFTVFYLVGAYTTKHWKYVLLFFLLQSILNPVTNYFIQTTTKIKKQFYINLLRNILANLLYYFTYIWMTDFSFMFLMALPGSIANGFVLRKTIPSLFTTFLFILPFMLLPDTTVSRIIVAFFLISIFTLTSFSLSNFMYKKIYEAEQASRAKSYFLAHMSHEIRTPMNGVLGMTEILLGMENDESKRFYLNTIKESGNALINILNDILDLSKLQSDKLVFQEDVVDLRDLFERTAELFFPVTQKKGVELILDIPLHMESLVRTDAYRVRQILVNLLGNAVKFTEHGYIKLSARLKRVENDKVGIYTIEVQDSGIGITEAQKQIIFSEFTQADESFTRKYGGTGLGLSISKKIVEAMGGDIDLTSIAEIGSTFKVTLPLVIESSPADHEKLIRLLKNQQIIMVDHSEEKSAVFRNELKTWNMHNEIFPTLKEAEQYLKDHQFDSAIFIIDDNISEHGDVPKRNGMEIILCRSAGSCLQEKRNEFKVSLFKPITAKKLAEGVRKIVEGSSPPVQEADNVRKQDSTDPASTDFRVLIADDDDINLMILGRILDKLGFHYKAVYDGREVVQEALINPYDILILDIEMPHMSGIDALKKIRDEIPAYKNVPALACTAHALKDNRQRFLNAGFADCIVKPFYSDDIKLKIDSAMTAFAKKS